MIEAATAGPTGGDAPMQLLAQVVAANDNSGTAAIVATQIAAVKERSSGGRLGAGLDGRTDSPHPGGDAAQAPNRAPGTNP